MQKRNVNWDFTKRQRNLAIIIAVLAVFTILGVIAFNLFTEYIWMDSLNFGSIFTTILTTKVLISLSGFVLFFILMLATVYWIRKSYLSHFHATHLPPIIKEKKWAYPSMLVIAFFVGLIGSSIIKAVGWEPTLKLLNYVSFNKTDPYFGLDVSFYIFVLPFLKFVIYTLLNALIFLFVIQAGAYYAFNIYRMNRSAQVHMAITILGIGILLAATHFLGKYDTLLTEFVNYFQKSVVHGLSYTDHIINIPKAYVLTGTVLIVAVWIMVNLFRGKITASLTPIAIYLAILILGQGASVLVQNFVVSPNEFSKEKPYLEHNLEFTKAAYGLDEIDIKESPNEEELSEELMKNNQLTVDNVRLNDSRPLLDIYNQLQTFRTYYQFNDIDIDRYEIDGEYEQVFIGARELSTKNLPEQAQTWVNKNLRYTHGYGVAMSHVNKVTSQGQPEYMMRNIPVEGVLDVTRPQVYFGEEDYPDVMVNSKVEEFDYPTGDENATNTYDADLGIQLKGMNKLLFAIKEKSIRMFVSDQLTDESQLLKTRNINDRINAIAPFLQYDNDPYIVVRDDGSLVWLIDAYVSEENYPYSESYDGYHNYIRNSVKVSVDAYSGEVDFYIVNEDDPVVQTYNKIFPDLFTEEIPEDIDSHFRYPVDLFKIQTDMYGTYHMSNLEVFYNREDFWQKPTEKYFNQDIEMEPYYITMKLPDSDHEEFILMSPYTPKNRQNMISWMGVQNDGEDYGNLFVHKFPKQKNVYGPQQIENRINQDSVISQQLNLWSQGGSEVIRGNLLVIPIEDTVLYVEPVYIESSNETSLPEVKQVVIAYDDYIVMESTFEKSMEKILELIESGVKPPPSAPEPDESVEDLEDNETTEETPEADEPTNDEPTSEDEKPSEDSPALNAEDALLEVGKLFDDYQTAVSKGNWVEAGEIMDKIQKQLDQINE